MIMGKEKDMDKGLSGMLRGCSTAKHLDFI